jgi:hypothetical protein
MSEATRILSSMGQGDPHAAEQLLPLVYDQSVAFQMALGDKTVEFTPCTPEWTRAGRHA